MEVYKILQSSTARAGWNSSPRVNFEDDTRPTDTGHRRGYDLIVSRIRIEGVLHGQQYVVAAVSISLAATLAHTLALPRPSDAPDVAPGACQFRQLSLAAHARRRSARTPSPSFRARTFPPPPRCHMTVSVSMYAWNSLATSSSLLTS